MQFDLDMLQAVYNPTDDLKNKYFLKFVNTLS